VEIFLQTVAGRFRNDERRWSRFCPLFEPCRDEFLMSQKNAAGEKALGAATESGNFFELHFHFKNLTRNTRTTRKFILHGFNGLTRFNP